MGAHASAPALGALEDAGPLLAALAGRTIDLPGGDEAVFVSRPTTHPVYHHMRRDAAARTTPMHFVGRAYAILPCRKFMLYLMRGGAVYGYEPASGLHRLADSLRELLTTAGLQQRDLRCLDVAVLDAQMDPIAFTTPEILVELGADSGVAPPSVRPRRSTRRRASPRPLPPAGAHAPHAFCAHQLAEGSILDLCAPGQASPPACAQRRAAAAECVCGSGEAADACDCGGGFGGGLGPPRPRPGFGIAPESPRGLAREGSVRSVFF
ncbi:myristylated tegument protein CIRC [Cervid alphaherpesvirus 2]|uniref:Myristylated tegument protein CIRC n=1 Tax=Cervid alphaherpesvirus 2 TaxID=365327 RepID=A0A455JN97_9ALPH|nr:myristylated tegument protein CIRC [Cervid alphaherpesvirus 2]AVT50724.1 myristylated tegument protein CIRC [Cervid alphaherpesvirus 2]